MVILTSFTSGVNTNFSTELDTNFRDVNILASSAYLTNSSTTYSRVSGTGSSGWQTMASETLSTDLQEYVSRVRFNVSGYHTISNGRGSTAARAIITFADDTTDTVSFGETALDSATSPRYFSYYHDEGFDKKLKSFDIEYNITMSNNSGNNTIVSYLLDDTGGRGSFGAIRSWYTVY